jgi:predicted amidohydrolase YtcJ
MTEGGMPQRGQIQIVTAATVHTLEPAHSPEPSHPDAFAMLGQWIVATGTLPRLRETFPDAPVHDFGERTVLPGFNDAHQHPTSMASQLLDVDLSPELVVSREQLLGLLAERAGQTERGHWVQGSRYDHTKTTAGTVLTRDDLDQACPDHPVFMRHIAMHWGVLNSAGLRAAGLTDDSQPPVGGEFGRDATGRLNGLVYERAMHELMDEVIPPASLADRLDALRRYQRMMHAAGITSVGDALVYPDGVRLLQEAYARGELSMRVNMLLAYPALDALDALGLRSGLGDEWLRFGGVKGLVDGAVAGGTCMLEQPYEDGCDHGIQAMPTDELTEFVRRVHDAGGTACVHANGDKAIRLLLDAVEAAQRDNPRPGARHRIEHCTVVDPEIVKRIRALDMVAVPFGSYIAFHGDKLPGYYGMDRLSRMFAHRDLLDAGIPVAGSSDFPCGPYEVLLALQSCVTRRALSPDPTVPGVELGANQRISTAEALALYTTGSAYASGEEHRKGRLSTGMLADFVVLDRDPLSTPGEELAAIGVSETWVGGRPVWRRADEQ